MKSYLLNIVIAVAYQSGQIVCMHNDVTRLDTHEECWSLGLSSQAKKKICGFPVSSYKNLGRVGRF
jgi:hypothetical protein